MKVLEHQSKSLNGQLLSISVKKKKKQAAQEENEKQIKNISVLQCVSL